MWDFLSKIAHQNFPEGPDTLMVLESDLNFTSLPEKSSQAGDWVEREITATWQESRWGWQLCPVAQLVVHAPSTPS